MLHFLTDSRYIWVQFLPNDKDGYTAKIKISFTLKNLLWFEEIKGNETNISHSTQQQFFLKLSLCLLSCCDLSLLCDCIQIVGIYLHFLLGFLTNLHVCCLWSLVCACMDRKSYRDFVLERVCCAVGMCAGMCRSVCNNAFSWGCCFNCADTIVYNKVNKLLHTCFPLASHRAAGKVV